MRSKSLSILLSALLSCCCLAAAADEPTATPAAAESAPATLRGAVVQIDVTLNDLRDARLAVSRARKATANLYDEVTRQQMTMSFNPNIIGTTMIMTPRPTFSGQFLPARSKWVTASMSEIGPIINLFKEDVDAAIESNRRTNVRESTRQSLDPVRDEAFADVKSSFEIFNQLQKLTAAGGNYDNSAIAAAANSLDEKMKHLDRSLKRGISILQKEAKAAKKGQA